MSQMSDRISSLRSMLIKHKNQSHVVIDTFFDVVAKEELWDYDDLIFILESAKGLDINIDEFLVMKQQIVRQWRDSYNGY